MYRSREIFESFTNQITMYMTTVYALIGIVTTTLILSLTSQLSFTPTALIGTLVIILISTYATSRLFAWTFSTQHNRESWLITALILYLTVAPGDTTLDYIKLALVAGIATASKYFIAWRGRHIFNPAAVALTLGSLTGLTSALWWVATPLLLLVVVLAGAMVVSKTRRYLMASVFTFTALFTSVVVALVTHYPILDALRLDVISGPLIFFAAIMLTEPLTSPATRKWQLLYAVTMGIIYSAQLPWLSTPSVALLVGNILAFGLIFRGTARLQINSIRKIAPRTYEILAKPLSRLTYRAGQYAELSLPHSKQDNRGMRRVLSFASSPSEAEVRFVTKLPAASSSSFKQALVKLERNAIIRSTYVGGDFTLSNHATEFVFIAGGIGITPFIAMISEMLATHDTRAVTLFYCVQKIDTILYQDLLSRAESEINLTVVLVAGKPPANWRGESGTFTIELLRRHVDNILVTHVYISGAPSMVSATRTILTQNQIKPSHIVTDYFTGY